MSRSVYFVARSIATIALLGFAMSVHAAAPSGNDWFQVLANPFTGGDNTGDGGSGLPADLNYYYVGQSFVGTVQINVATPAGSNAANIWIDYSTTTESVSTLTVGSFFPFWSGQVVSSTIGRIFSTGFQTVGHTTGQGSFGTATFTMLKPTAANYGTGSPETLDINIGAVGATTESNISNNGVDILDDAEDFQMHVWADTKKPYALNPNPANAAAAVSIDSGYNFDLRDSKNGEGDNTGVGTGVNTVEPPGSITTNDGGGAVNVTSYDSFSCSGVWGTNLCGVAVDPPPPSGIPGDTRNWNYSTTYTVIISGYQDLASSNQDQLGDTNGPNTMDPKTFTFTTEADTVAPRVVAETPVRGSSGNSVGTNIVVDVTDRKTYPNGPSGVGVAPATCRFNVSAPSSPLATYQQGNAGVSVVAINYGYRFTINPATDFTENETVSVSAYDCEDLAANVMITDNWTFLIGDSAPPYVQNESPSNDQTATLNQNVTFHLKDDGTGVDLANTVIFMNGVYYTNGGGAGQVTVNGTRITFASSLNFNINNYVGDTSSRTGTTADETFVLDPQANFTAGEAIPVIIYSRDLSGNLMEYVVYAFVGTGSAGACPAASSFCGSGTSFNGSQCVSSGGTCSSDTDIGGAAAQRLEVNEPLVNVSQIDENSVLVTWTTTVPSNSQVVYDNKSAIHGGAPRYDYRFTTPVAYVTSTYHAVEVTGLVPGMIYFFRPVSTYYSEAAGGQERIMLAHFRTEIITETRFETIPANIGTGTLVCPNPVVIPTQAVRPAPIPVQPPVPPPAPPVPPVVIVAGQDPRITSIKRRGKALIMEGLADPNLLVTVIIY